MTSKLTRRTVFAAMACLATYGIGMLPLHAQEPDPTLVAAAKKEGRVTVYAALIPPVVKAIKVGFAKKYPGIVVDSIFKPGSPLLAQLMTEESAGRHICDALLNEVSRMPPAYAKGFLAKYNPPEKSAYDAKWISNPPGYWIEFQAMPMGVLYNRTLVPANEKPTNLHDVLDPRWKGKIAITSPVTNDMMLNYFAGLMRDYGDEKSKQFFKELAAQKPMIIGPSGARIGQGVDTGEFPIGFGYLTQIYSIGGGMKGSMRVGGDDAVYAVPGNAAAVMKNAQHPNAAKLFINYVLSHEVQAMLASKFGYVSRRHDVSLPDAMADIKLHDAPALEPKEASVVRQKISEDFGLPTGRAH